jgi:hypothetical protein
MSHITTPLEVKLGLDICATAPPGLEPIVADLGGYVFWSVVIIFVLGLLVAVGSIIGGRMFGLQHASKVGAISIVVTIVTAVVLVILIPVVTGIIPQCIQV